MIRPSFGSAMQSPASSNPWRRFATRDRQTLVERIKRDSESGGANMKALELQKELYQKQFDDTAPEYHAAVGKRAKTGKIQRRRRPTADRNRSIAKCRQRNGQYADPMEHRIGCRASRQVRRQCRRSLGPSIPGSSTQWRASAGCSDSAWRWPGQPSMNSSRAG